MKEYLLIFRSNTAAYSNPNPEELAKSMEQWKNWIGGIAEQGKFNAGQPLTQDGKVMRSNSNITDAPFAEGKEVVNGYLLIKAADYNEACKLSAGCPIFEDAGGSIEVREINMMVM
ncbi:MAG: hypothetical protein JST82_03530 [Bacteroidetes bacterium]|nr:hypothetical protein [Bacteroidota bacterium]